MSSDPDADTAELHNSTPDPELEPPTPFSSLVRVDIAGFSHAGKVRPTNEDNFLIGRLGRFLDVVSTSLADGETPLHSSEVGYGMAVADGMGGAAAGEVASSLAIRLLVNAALNMPDWIMRLDENSARRIQQRAIERYREIDAEISKHADENPTLSGMGTTLTLALSLGQDLFLTQVGDSRAYLFRNGKLLQATKDQTLVQNLVDAGQLTREQAAAHHLRHVLTQALGRQHGNVTVELRRLQLLDGDCLVLCSDGLTEMVPEGMIAETLSRETVSEAACRSLVQLALDRGGADNITVIVARYAIPESG
jgi:protein phosphatase